MGAYAELDSLVALQFKAGGFSLKHNQPVHSLLFGRRASHVRGRGLDFEEIRSYVSGDDVRTIDWRVTARTQKPCVRVYSEERDRPTMLVADQRINMFFGSRVSMKSVVAAEVCALAAWRVFHQGDRAEAFIFNDDSTEWVRMHRSRATVLRILERISYQNHLLRSDSASLPKPERLNEILLSVARVCRRDALIVIASDFDGADQITRDLLLRPVAFERRDLLPGLRSPCAEAAAGRTVSREQWRVTGGASPWAGKGAKEHSRRVRPAHSRNFVMAA